MIKYVTGDILQTEAQAIAHGIAPHDDFKQGLALSLRENWPALYKDFRHYCKTTSPKSGELWTWKGAGGPMIINLMTQEPPPSAQGHPGRATVQHVNHCLKNLLKEIKEQDVQSLALTRLATGVGGLDWQEVKPLMESALSELPIPIYIYETFEKGTKAQEA
jgi:O-acetyl-ADP-ribose deacetylase (regulator of RNase III)